MFMYTRKGRHTHTYIYKQQASKQARTQTRVKPAATHAPVSRRYGWMTGRPRGVIHDMGWPCRATKLEQAASHSMMSRAEEKSSASLERVI